MFGTHAAPGSHELPAAGGRLKNRDVGLPVTVVIPGELSPLSPHGTTPASPYSTHGFTHARWGAPASSGLGDVPVPGDYDGDFRADVAIYRGSTGEWFIQRSSDGGLTHASWGAPARGDLPLPATY